MPSEIILLLVIIVLAVVFDFINGFHDTANAIATVVATRVLTPLQAISMAAVFNFLGAITGTEVAKTVGAGLVDANTITQGAVAAALLAVGAVASFAMAARAEDVPARTALASFPLVLGDWRGREMEIDALNGVVVRQGRARGVPTPYSAAVHALLEGIEVSDRRT